MDWLRISFASARLDIDYTISFLLLANEDGDEVVWHGVTGWLRIRDRSPRYRIYQFI